MQLRATGTVDRMAASEAAAAKAKLPRSRHWSYTLINWLGLVPFLLFCLLFEILPAIMIIQGSLSNSDTGTFTLNNYQRVLNEADKLHAFQNSIYISLVTALIGTVIGFLAAYGVFNLRRSSLRNFIIGFSSIAANFAGVPLAFAFVSTLGVTGFVTVLFLKLFHVDLYNGLNFSLYSFWGLVLAYLYFEFPLMI